MATSKFESIRNIMNLHKPLLLNNARVSKLKMSRFSSDCRPIRTFLPKCISLNTTKYFFYPENNCVTCVLVFSQIWLFYIELTALYFIKTWDTDASWCCFAGHTKEIWRKCQCVIALRTGYLQDCIRSFTRQKVI